MKVAISGAGAIAERAHLPVLQQTPGVEVVAIQSRTAEKAEHLARSLWPDAEAARRPRAYADFDEMIQRERPDAVGVFTPNHLHCIHTLKALAAGAHVLVEKPMAPTVAEARRMVAAAEKEHKILMVAQQQRHSGLEQIVKQAIAAGAIGTPHFIRARLSHGGPEFWAPGQSWFRDRRQAGGGAMLDLGVHVADLTLWMMGEASAVYGQVAALRAGAAVEDHGVMVVNFCSGALGVIEASWSSRPGLSAIEIYGDDGRVMIGYPRLDIAIQRADGSAPPGYSRAEILARIDPTDLRAPTRSLISNFVAAIEGRAAPSPDGQDGLRAVELVEACYRSSRDGSRVSLPLE